MFCRMTSCALSCVARFGMATPRSGRRTIAIDLDPLSLLCRLAASVPPRGNHLEHYAGCSAPPPSCACWLCRLRHRSPRRTRLM